MKDGNSKELKFHIKGLDCIGCVPKIETYSKCLKGVTQAEVNFSQALLIVKIQNSEKVIHSLTKGLHKLGYQIEEVTNKNNIKMSAHLKNTFNKNKKFKAFPKSNTKHINLLLPPKTVVQRNNFIKFSSWKFIILLCFIYFILFLIENFLKINLQIYFSCLTITLLLPIMRKCFLMAKVGYFFSVELLMSISAIGAIIIGASEEAAAVLILYLIGEKLESFSTEKAKKEINSLVNILPENAIRITTLGQKEFIPAKMIQINDVLEIKPGDRFPVDAIVRNGESYVNESLLTGESKPIFKRNNDPVIAGTNNIDSFLQVQATSQGENNTVTRLVKLITDAQASKTKVMRSIEKFSKIYTPIILILGIITAIIPPLFLTEPWLVWIYRGLAILLIGCPCALIISTPSAISAGIIIASKLGILIKNASALETIGRIKQIAFDKTGTLTYGKLNITNITPITGSINEVLQVAASIESKTNHPLAKAIIDHANEQNLTFYEIEQPKTLAGIGAQGIINGQHVIVCSPQYAQQIINQSFPEFNAIKNLQHQGNTIVCVIVNFCLLGYIAFTDTLRPDAKVTIKNLNTLKINSIILTGDNIISAQNIAKELNIEVKAELLPENKLEYISAVAKTKLIAMVGDGINDAPALAAANISVAMGNGTNIAIDTSQIIIARNKLTALIDAILISKKVMSTIQKNIIIALGLKIIFLFLTLFGGTQLWMAILADTGATLIVTLNSLRILMYKSQINS